MKKKLKKLWKKKLTKIIVGVALIATGNEFLGYPLLTGLMEPAQMETIIEIETKTDSELIKPISKEGDK